MKSLKHSVPVLLLAASLAACSSGEKKPDSTAEGTQLGKTESEASSTDITSQKEVTATVLEEHKIPTVKSGTTRADINRIDAEQLQVIGVPQDVSENLIKYREDLGGKFSSVDQLKSVPGMNDQLFQKISPMLGVG